MWPNLLNVVLRARQKQKPYPRVLIQWPWFCNVISWMNVWTNTSPAACSESLAGILTAKGTWRLQVVYNTLNLLHHMTTTFLRGYVFPWDLCELLCSCCSVTLWWSLGWNVFPSVYKPWSVALLKDALWCTWRLNCITPAVCWSRLAQKGVVIDLLFKSGLPHGFFQGIISMSLGWQDMKLRVFWSFLSHRGVYTCCVGNVASYTLSSLSVQGRII